jgi:hypothetical protein
VAPTSPQRGVLLIGPAGLAVALAATVVPDDGPRVTWAAPKVLPGMCRAGTEPRGASLRMAPNAPRAPERVVAADRTESPFDGASDIGFEDGSRSRAQR